MKFLRTLLISFILLTAPLSAQAANATFFGPIVPEACSACPCGYGGVLQIIQNLMNFAIAIAIIIATLFIAWAGLQYILSSTNPESRSSANKMLINAAVGLLIVLSAWLIVDFVMKSLYSGEENYEGKFGPWNTILKGGQECLVGKPNKALFDGNIFAVPGEGSGTGTGGVGVVTEGKMTQAAAEAALKAGGVGMNAGIKLTGVRADSINQIVAVKAACNCQIIVTSATGGKHASGTYSHENGYKVDIGLNGPLNSYLQSLRPGGTRSGDNAALYYDQCGNEYAKESNHWDITTNKGVCSPPTR